MLGIFLAPLNFSTNQNQISVTKNNILAQATTGYIYEYTNRLTGNTVESPIYTTIEICNIERQKILDNNSPITGWSQEQKDTITPCKPTTQTSFEQGVELTTGYDSNSPNGNTCGAWPGTWHVCIVGWIHYLIFQPVAFFARIAARILDFFIFYSLQSSSYEAPFIEKGWSTVRDIANIFFIIALLYVALKTALALNSTDNKRMIGTIVVIALVINFSLFATQIVIDASNILAKIFYANIESVDENGQQLVEETKEKSITVGLVRTFKPQTIFGFSNISDDLNTSNVGSFFAVMVIAILIMFYMIIMFLTVALIFVGRVAMLWLLMIFSPIAFVSLTIPGIKIPTLGWEEWKKQLFDNAFVAPIFVFLLYLIILFGDIVALVTGSSFDSSQTIDSAVIDGATNQTFDKYVKIIIPFILIFILLKTAKDIAIKMSGEIGQTLSKAGGAVAGGVVGGMLGAAALVGTRTIGRVAASVGGSDFAEKLRNSGTIRDENGNVIGAKKGLGAWAARQGLKTIDYGQKSTFDIRKTGVGSFLGKQSGVDLENSKFIGLGSKDEGYIGYKKRRDEKAKEEAELYKTTMNDIQTKEYTIRRREEYLEKKAKEAVVREKTEKAKQGVVLTDAQIKQIRDDAKTNNAASAPKVYEKAADLDKERMVMFKDRFGQSDLISALAHSTVTTFGGTVTQENFQDRGMQESYLKAFKEKKKKKEREDKALKGDIFKEDEFEKEFEDEMKKRSLGLSHKYESELGKIVNNKIDGMKFDVEIAKTINDRKAENVKIGLGAAATLATGGVGAAAFGAGTGIALGAVTGATLSGQSYFDKKANEDIITRMDKEAKNSENLANRIADLTKTLKDGKGLTRTETDINHVPLRDPVTGEILKKKIDLFNGENVDKDKLNKRIVENDTEIEILKEQLKNDSTNTDLINKFNEAKLEREILTGLKSAEEKLFQLTGKKPNQGGSSAPSTPPPTP